MKRPRTPLHVAVMEERLEAVDELVRQGADINAQDLEEMTPLHLAIELRNLDIIKLLLKAGADMFIRDQGPSPFMFAVRSCNWSIINLFIETAGGVNALRDPRDHTTVLHEAARKGNFNIVKMLLERGANVAARDKYDDTPLIKAWESVNPDIFRILIDNGAEVNARDVGGNTVMHHLAEANNEDLITLLVEAGADVNVSSYCGSTPLHVACASQNIKVIKRLIEFGANVDERDESELKFPLLMAVQSENLEIAKLLIDSGVNLDAISQHGHSPLKLAASRLNLDMMKLLVHSGANVNDLHDMSDVSLKVFLRHCAISGITDEKFIAEGAKLFIDSMDVNVRYKEGRNIFKQVLQSYRLKPMREFFYKIVLRHIALMEEMDHPIDEALLTAIRRKQDYHDYFTSCRQELARTRWNRLKGCWVKFYNLLVDGRHKFVKYAGNEILMKDLKAKVADYPIYGPDMLRNMAEGTAAREIRDDAAVTMSNCLPIMDPYHLIINDVLDLLDQKDWKKFNEEE